MTDVRSRLHDLDGLETPDLWGRIRAQAASGDMRSVADAPGRPSGGRRARAALVAAAVFAVAGIFAWQTFRPLQQAAPSTAPRAHGIWSTLHRPLRLPGVVAGSCPASPVVQITPVGGGFSGGPFPAIGAGPVYVVAEPSVPTVLRPRDQVAHGWYDLKTIFTIDTSYGGPLLIRAAQLDGSGGIGLQGSSAPEDPVPTELRLDATSEGGNWRSWPQVTLVRSAGCFAYQIDGTSFTEVIVFATTEP